MVGGLVRAPQTRQGQHVVRTKLKHVLSGKVVDQTFNSDTKVDTANVDRRDMHTFTTTVPASCSWTRALTISSPFRRHHRRCEELPARGAGRTVAMHDGTPLYLDLPASVELVITYTEPGLQGDRSTGGTEPATVRDRPADSGSAVHDHRREGQGRHPYRRLPGPRRSLLLPGSSTRSKARKRALDILFEAELRGTDPLATLAQRTADADPPVRDYTAVLVGGVEAHRPRSMPGSPHGWHLAGPCHGCPGSTALRFGSRSSRSTLARSPMRSRSPKPSSLWQSFPPTSRRHSSTACCGRSLLETCVALHSESMHPVDVATNLLEAFNAGDRARMR